MFIALYVIPFIIVLLGSIPWVRKNDGLGVPMFLLAICPALNCMAAGAVVVIRIYQFVDKTWS